MIREEEFKITSRFLAWITGSWGLGWARESTNTGVHKGAQEGWGKKIDEFYMVSITFAITDRAIQRGS